MSDGWANALPCPPLATPMPTARESESTVKCTRCGHETEMATPAVKLCMKSYFAGILEVKKDKAKIGERNNLKVRISHNF